MLSSNFYCSYSIQLINCPLIKLTAIGSGKMQESAHKKIENMPLNDNATQKSQINKNGFTIADKDPQNMFIKQKGTKKSQRKYLYNSDEVQSEKQDNLLLVQSIICAVLITIVFLLKFFDASSYYRLKTSYEIAISHGVNFSEQTPILRFIDESVKTMQNMAFDIGNMAKTEDGLNIITQESQEEPQENIAEQTMSGELTEQILMQSENNQNENQAENEFFGMGGKTQESVNGENLHNVNYDEYSKNIELTQPAVGVLTSEFGYRTNPISKQWEFHLGIDIAAEKGSDVFSAASGFVVECGSNDIRGNYIIIHHESGLQTLYQHLDYTFARQGQSVTKGERIATMGTTGYSTGPHLHFELIENGKYTNPISEFEQLQYTN